MIFQTEKALTDLEGKIEAEEKEKAEGELGKLRSLNESLVLENMSEADTNNLKEATDTLTQAFYAISEKLYQQAAEAQQSQGGDEGEEGPFNPDDIVDSDNNN